MNTDIIIIGIFLLINLSIGFYYGQGNKTVQDYALGGRNFGTGALVATIVATWISGSMFFSMLTNIYSEGIWFFIAALFFPLSFLIPAYILVPKMKSFLGKTSIAEAMGDIYGERVRMIVALAGIIGSAGSVAVQFKVFGNIFGTLFSISQAELIITIGTIVTVYSAFGGVRSVSYTDMLQFAAFGCVIPILGVVIWYKLQATGDFSLAKALTNPKFSVSEALNWEKPGFLAMVFLFIYFMIPSLKPAWFQRVSMGRDIQQVKKAFIIASGIILTIVVLLAWVPFLIYNVDSNIDANNLYGYILDNYSILGIRSLLLIALTAMAMSTADSYINASCVLFANDLCRPFKLNDKQILNLSRIFALVLGGVAIGFSFISKNLLKIILFSNSFYVPLVTPVMFITILGFRTTTKSVLIAMAAGFITVILWKVAGIKEDVIAVSIVVNLVFLFGSHYLLKQPGGWVAVPEIEGKKSWQERLSCLSPTAIAQYLKDITPKSQSTYSGLGIYVLIFTLSAMYTTEAEMSQENSRLVLNFYQALLAGGVIMTMFPIWPKIIKRPRLVEIMWPLAIFSSLLFCSWFFILLSNFHPLQFAIFTTNNIIAIMLLGWRAGSLLMLLSCVLGWQFFGSFYAERLAALNVSPSYIFIYCLILLGSVILLFLKPKQDYLGVVERRADELRTEGFALVHKMGNMRQKVANLTQEMGDMNQKMGSMTQEMDNLNEKVSYYKERDADQQKEIERLGATSQRILNNLNHELRLPVGNVMNFAEMLSDGLGKYNPEQLKSLADEVFKNSNRLSSMILNMLDLATLSAKKLELDKRTINFSELVKERVKKCRAIYLGDKPIDFEFEIDPEILVAMDANYIKQVVDNLVINAINFSAKGVIKVQVKLEKEFVSFIISDEGIGIPRTEVYDIFTPFKMGSNAESKAEGRGVGLALCRAAIEAHEGQITAVSQEVGATFRFSLPLNAVSSVVLKARAAKGEK